MVKSNMIIHRTVWVVALFVGVTGHGRMTEPPSRSSMWRRGFANPVNYNDNALYCGGFGTQWYENNGQCGVCGDNFKDPQPRDNEGGGTFGRGLITRSYPVGGRMRVDVEITANHKGYFVFSLCVKNDPLTPASESCFDQHLLKEYIFDLTSLEGLFIPEHTLHTGTGRIKWALPSEPTPRVYTLYLQLPPGVACSHCVLRWKYRAGNNWGFEDGKSGLGLGKQEHFYACSDITIGSNHVTISGPKPTDPIPAVTKPATYNCVPVGVWADNPSMFPWCVNNCPEGPTLGMPCDGSYCRCTRDNPVGPDDGGPVTQPPMTTLLPVTGPVSYTCVPVGIWAEQPDMFGWCVNNCPDGPTAGMPCDGSYCRCTRD